MSRLQNPALPAKAVVETHPDGSASCNDGTKLRAANRNPYYVLATIHGEIPELAASSDHDQDPLKQNRAVRGQQRQAARPG